MHSHSVFLKPLQLLLFCFHELVPMLFFFSVVVIAGHDQLLLKMSAEQNFGNNVSSKRIRSVLQKSGYNEIIYGNKVNRRKPADFAKKITRTKIFWVLETSIVNWWK